MVTVVVAAAHGIDDVKDDEEVVDVADGDKVEELVLGDEER